MEQNSSYKNPYPGIRSFNINEDGLFFGRDKQITELLDILGNSHFAAISGASGSGKSSLIKAGLIPRIIQDKEKWDFVSSRPGNDPVGDFSILLHEMLHKGDYDRKKLGSIRKNKNLFLESEKALSEFLQRLDYKKNLLIYIDQFEEIFRYKNDEQNTEAEKNAESFVKMLLSSVKDTDTSIYVILSLRSDFLGECSYFQGLSETINKGHYLIPKMTYDQKMESVIGPAKSVGIEITEALLERLKKDISKKTDNLLVLQHAMMRTWDYKLLHSDPNSPIDVKHYEAIGTMSDALSIHAETIYNSCQDDESRKLLERVFKALTELGEDKKGIRRPATLKEISKITGTHEHEIMDVTDLYREEGNSFLMPDKNTILDSDSVIDISHESIMKVWSRLSEWVSEETKSAQTYLRLSRSAELYQEGKGGLLVNPDLQLALQWMKDNQPNQAWAERYDPAFDRVISYIEYSQKEYEKALAAKEEKQKKRIKRTRAVAVFLGTASLISILFLIVAMNLKIKAEASENKAKENEKIALTKSKYAEEQKRDAVSNELIAQQQQLIAEQHRLLAEEQKEIAVFQRAIAAQEKTKAVNAKKEVVKEKRKVESLLETTEELRVLAIKRESKAIEERKKAIQAEKKAIAARKLSTSKSLAIQAIKIFKDNKKTKRLTQEQQELPYQLSLYAYHFYKTNAKREYDSDIFNSLSLIAENNVLIRSPEGHSATVRQAIFAPDGKNFVSVADDGTLRTFNTGGKLMNVFDLKTAFNKNEATFSGCLAYSPNSKFVAAGNDKGSILIKKATGISFEPVIIKAHDDAVKEIVFINNTDLLSIGNDGKLILHQNFEFGNKQQVLLTSNQRLTGLALNINNNKVAIAGQDGKIMTFSADKPNEIKKANIENISVSSICWGKNNDLFIATTKGKIFIMREGKVKEDFFAHTSAINTLVYDPTNNKLFSCSYDQTIKIWNYNNFDYAAVLERGHSWVHSIDLSVNRSFLLAAYEDNSIEIIDINIGSLLESVKKDTHIEMSEKNWNRFIGTGIERSKNKLKHLFDID